MRSTSIAGRLFGAVFLFSVIITLIMTGVRTYIDYRNEVAALDREFERLEKTILPAVAESLWVMDRGQLGIALNGFLQIPHFEKTEIQLEGETILAAGQVQSRRVIRKKFPLFHQYKGEQMYVGSLFVDAGLDSIYDGISTRFYQRLGYEAGQIFLISLFLFLIVQRLVTKHLSAMADHVTRISLRTPGGPLVLTRRGRRGSEDELDTVVRSINAMQVNLQRALGELEVELETRKKAEEILARSRAEFQAIVNSLSDAVVFMDKGGRIAFVNPAFSAMFGYAVEDARGRTVDFLFAGNGGSGDEATFPSGADAGVVTPFREAHCRRRDGTVFLSEFLEVEVRDANSDVIGFLSIHRDITERKAEEEKRRSLATIIETAPDGVCSIDRVGTVVSWNKGAEEMLGYRAAEIIGSPVSTIIPVEIAERELAQCIAKLEESGSFKGYESVRMKKDGQVVPVEVSAVALRDRQGLTVGYASVMRDVSERRRLEDELIRMEKLDSLGVLAGGIAHDFNNLLTAILGNVSLAKLFSDPDGKAYQRLGETEKACLRAKDLTQQLLTFSKGGTPVKETASLANVVRESVSFVLAGSRVDAAFSFSADLWQADIDSGQIGQVFQNLVLNAEEAMPGGGTVSIVGENVVHHGGGGTSLKYGEYVRVSVRDQGIGIPREHMQKIFDPFFTTKQKGSGLGLATAYSIVTRHGGLITVDSQLGVGTVFHVMLPASHKAAVPGVGTSAGVFRGRGKILVMDDEEVVRDVALEILKSMGYEACAARDGAEAVVRYVEAKEAGNPFDVVIMDLTIPGGMGGRETVGRLREIDPEVKAIVSSGYSNDPVMAHFQEHGFRAVIRKPYNVTDMGTVLHGVLGGDEGRTS